MKKLQHPNLVKYYGFMQQISTLAVSTSTTSTPALVQYHVVWEKLEQSLADFICAYGPVKDLHRLGCCVAQVVSGLSYLHQRIPRMDHL